MKNGKYIVGGLIGFVLGFLLSIFGGETIRNSLKLGGSPFLTTLGIWIIMTLLGIFIVLLLDEK